MPLPVYATATTGYNNTVDLLEICGGTGGIIKAAFRRKLSSGGNIDLTTGCNLDHPEVQKALFHYLDTCYVLVTILEPNCRSVGKFSNINAIKYHDTWRRHHEEDLPHIRFCGKVALRQRSYDRHWLREQPEGSWIDDIAPWDEVARQPGVVSCLMDQCMGGCKDDEGVAVRKRTEWKGSHEALLITLTKCSVTVSTAMPTRRGNSWRNSSTTRLGCATL